jgi:predicted RNase H-like HicB family nuclease
MSGDPWSDPDPQPGDFDAELEAIDPEEIEFHEGNPGAKVRRIKDEDAVKLRARRSERAMTEQLTLTIVYERDPDSEWITVSVPEVPGVLSQGKSREEAREMILDALAGMLELYASERAPSSEVIARESLRIAVEE